MNGGYSAPSFSIYQPITENLEVSQSPNFAHDRRETEGAKLNRKLCFGLVFFFIICFVCILYAETELLVCRVDETKLWL